jgi:phage replication-related protein YjqB (UPF0714/DUF867 family)
MAEPRSYEDLLASGYILGRDFSITFGDSKIHRCLLIAPHGGGIEPGTSEIMRAVARMGSWAWYDFAGFLQRGNKEALHITSTSFNEPTLKNLLPRANFVVAFHGTTDTDEPTVYVGGKWEAGRQKIVAAINEASLKHGIQAVDAIETAAVHLRGLEPANITNQGKSAEGVQLEFSRGARNLLFPPNASREARGRRSVRLRSLAIAIHAAVGPLCDAAAANAPLH